MSRDCPADNALNASGGALFDVTDARVAWTIAGVTTDRQKELLGRYRMASGQEREFVLRALREHAAENFPELEAP